MATKTLLTLEEFCALPEQEPDGTRYELSEGELVRLSAPGVRHGLILSRIIMLLGNTLADDYVVAAGDVGCLLDPNPEAATLRGADIAVVRRESLADDMPHGWLRGAPLLAVEIISPGNTAKDMQLKVKQYLKAGALEVWLVYPDTRTVYVHSAHRRDPQVLGEQDVIDSVVGQSFRIADFFRI